MGVLLRTGKDANPNGRPKGSKTKFRFDVAEILHKLGYCPFTELVKMARDEDWTKRERTLAAVELANFVAPKLKSIDHSIVSDSDKFQLIMNLAPSTPQVSAPAITVDQPED